jgi:oxygen-independent coproporphyrinogen-3 oxidase
MNYWRYGDFLGIGAGAHGKITLPSENVARRRIRQRHPSAWMRDVWTGSSVVEDRVLEPGERVFEFFLNQLRLRSGVLKHQLEPRTGVAWKDVSERVQIAVDKGFLKEENEVLSPTELGWRFSNEVQAIFLP